MSNRLKGELSPYLLQHANNPVDWYPWGDEAFNKARIENKPVLVSIGYAACHWCHVMERESFENEAVAAYMNAHFVCIKVDREEHPDVDHLYMDAVQAMSGSGGWPLNVFVNAARLPFYGGTYFPPVQGYGKPSWMQLLQHISRLWLENKADVEAQATQLKAHLQQLNFIGKIKHEKAISKDMCRQIAANILAQADKLHGGFGRAPKFPSTMAINYLLEHFIYFGNEEALAHALLSLHKMIDGGIYDQLGGGFARYATDAKWLVPHFEKMLYDNALIISSLSTAYAITKDKKISGVIADTIAFVMRELQSPEGAFYSALDADSEGHEGAYYTWHMDTWNEVLGNEFEAVAAYFDVTRNGNWEGTNILHVDVEKKAIMERYQLSASDLDEQLKFVQQKLFEARENRERPLTDDKSLMSWNALMNIALTDAGKSLENEDYLLKAEMHMNWVLQHFSVEATYLHTYKAGKARISANLDDLAYLVKALLALAQANQKPQYLLQAQEITAYIASHFKHESGPLFYFTSAAQEDIPVRKIDIYDGATPAANAVMAGNLMLLGLIYGKQNWLHQSYEMLQAMTGMVQQHSTSFGCWASHLQRYSMGMKTIVCTGPDAHKNSKELLRHSMPQCYVITSEKEIYDIPILENKFETGKNHIFVCTETACLQPESETGRVLQLLMS